jgi:hypothetical protein
MRVERARDITLSASSGEPGAGYRMFSRAAGKPEKSWMVAGFSIAVTQVPSVSVDQHPYEAKTSAP